MLNLTYTAKIENVDCTSPVYNWTLEGISVGISIVGPTTNSQITLNVDETMYVSDTANVVLTVTCLGCSKQVKYPILFVTA